MFVTLKVVKLIGPSNDGRRHGRGTYLFQSTCQRSVFKEGSLFNIWKSIKSAALPSIPVCHSELSLSKALEFRTKFCLIISFLSLDLCKDNTLVKFAVEQIGLCLELMSNRRSIFLSFLLPSCIRSSLQFRRILVEWAVQNSRQLFPIPQDEYNGQATKWFIAFVRSRLLQSLVDIE
jgi:hypothetical protein